MSYVCTQREFHEILNEIEDRVSDVLNMKDLDPHSDTFGWLFFFHFRLFIRQKKVIALLISEHI